MEGTRSFFIKIKIRIMQKKWLNAPALLLIDIQKGFENIEYYGGERNNPQAEHNAEVILEFWRKNKWPLFHVRHDSLNPRSPLAGGQRGNEHRDEVRPLPGETVIAKNVNSAFIGTDLKERIDALGIRNIVIVGLTTQHCVSTTARMAGNFGYDTIIVADATAAFRSKGLDGETFPAQLVHDISLATLNREFAEVLSTEEILRSGLR
jgi:nicotinamidase-related amidase